VALLLVLGISGHVCARCVEASGQVVALARRDFGFGLGFELVRLQLALGVLEVLLAMRARCDAYASLHLGDVAEVLAVPALAHYAAVCLRMVWLLCRGGRRWKMLVMHGMRDIL